MIFALGMLVSPSAQGLLGSFARTIRSVVRLRSTVGRVVLLAWMALGCHALAAVADTTWLDEMDLSRSKHAAGHLGRDKPLSIAGKTYQRGVATHGKSTIWIEPNGADRFTATVGVDDGAEKKPAVQFRVFVDGKKAFDSGAMKYGQAAKPVDVSLSGAKVVLLLVSDAGDGARHDLGNWADAKLEYSGTKPSTVAGPLPREEAVILTPKPGPAPRINGPRIYGARPGNPFLYRIPTQGERPITFAAEGLPASLKLDATTGIITGTTPKRGDYPITFTAKNSHGQTTRAFKLVSGDTLALTPSMGWNHWYAHYHHVSDKLMREAADVMISSGMADVGYEYVNIDDCWMNRVKSDDPMQVGPFRDSSGNILPNKHFPDMKQLTDYIHGKGLKAGIYTSPGPLTCAGFAGAYQHEAADAKQFADWGFDFLKYDWCHYRYVAEQETGPQLARFKKPYQLMGDLLKNQKRDMVFNLCQYGMLHVWTWGAEVGGNSWRTAGDLGFELDRVFEVALANAKHREYQKPGAWNDPDYIQIGFVGDAHSQAEPKPCPLTPTEQYSYMSLWALSASPLIYSGDMGKLDPFTLNVLCNPEVIDINQDPLGQCGRVIPCGEDLFVMIKDLEDGSKAIGLANAGELAAEVVAKWSDIDIQGKQLVRDVWRQHDLGTADGEYRAQVPRRGVVLLRLSPSQTP
ncbi:MAG: NPCBM/NEW2 domain-containing protein [Pirellulales bacterium]|nr:NPCBM/NEW2 domain-containing protein [Pirellulales bacterium]